jgi:tripartite-type tricarboxylate transporter receptor subunit TctC
VISAAPDGHTLLYVTAANATNASLYSSLPFNFLRDIVPVAGLVEFTLVLVVNAPLPVHSIGEFVAYAKANPGKISMASFGVGTTSHLSGELLKRALSRRCANDHRPRQRPGAGGIRRPAGIAPAYPHRRAASALQ